MNILLFTAPGYVEHEHEMVEAMFRLGLSRLHLRKPDWTEAQIDDWLEALDPAWLHRIVLHDYHHLATAQYATDSHSVAHHYPVGGVHLNSRNPELLPELRHKQQAGQFTVSRSCHSLSELKEAKQVCDYVTLSPIYDSISKEGYLSHFSTEELRAAAEQGLIDEQVYALGGIQKACIDELCTLQFGGIAVLGTVWQSPDPVESLRELLRLVY